MVLMIRSI